MAGHECPMCAAVGRGDNHFGVEVFSGEFTEVHLERRTRLPGYCVAMWKHGHVAEPTDLDPARACGYWMEVLAVGRAVRARFDPVKINYMTLGNIVPHLHTHVVPRYRDDPAPGGPLAWEQIRTSDPVPDAELYRQAADLRALLSPVRSPPGRPTLSVLAAHQAPPRSSCCGPQFGIRQQGPQDT
jgi:diadenosine tetraphosphate (Ap4A) HIT family hydrolase